MTQLYFGIENLNLTNGQRTTLVTGLQAIGNNNSDPQPCKRNHWRIRTDNDAAIFEADFDPDTITIAAIKQRLATIFSVSTSNISHSTQQTAYGLVVTMTYQAVNRIRFILFGYDDDFPTWTVSKDAVLAYLAANQVAWDGAG